MPQPEDIVDRRIRETIKRSGWHISAIGGGPVPSYAHTLGAVDHRGYELIFAGGLYFARNLVADILNTATTVILRDGDTFDLRGEVFELRSVDRSWARLLARDAGRFLERDDVPFMQVLPRTHRTLDVPDLSRPYAATGVWRWLTEPWPYPVPRGSLVSTDVQVLAGGPVTACERWDEDLFSAHGPSGYTDADLRQAPLGTLVGIDASLEPMVRLDQGYALVRDRSDAPWSQPFDLLDKPLD